MQKYHHTNPTRCQSIRLFHLIQQIAYSTTSSTNISLTPIINADNIDRLLKATSQSRQQDLVKFIHQIDINNKQMNAQYWGYCIAHALADVKTYCEADYLLLHRYIKQLLSGIYVKPLQQWQQWDGMTTKTNPQKDEHYARIINICGQLSFFILKIDFMLFNSNINSINYCFSLINLFPGKTNQILQIYENILKGTFLETLQFALTMNVTENILIEMLKALCYLYQVLKYQPIKKILQPSFLLQPSTLRGLLQNIKDKRPQIKYYTCVMMAIMVNNVPALAGIVLNNKQLLVEISNQIAQTKQEQGLMYGIQFLIGVIKGFQGLNQSEKKQSMEVIITYLKFAVNKLFELKSQKNQSVCIKLVLQVVRIMDLDHEDVKLLKFASNVFEGPNNSKFQSLFELTLEITKYSLIYKRKNVQNFIIGDKSFQSYVKRILKSNLEQWEPFYSALQIILIMASSENCDILFQRDLVQDIIKLSSTKNSLVLFYLSQILLTLILNSLDSEWKITYLYQKGCMNVIGNLIGSSFKRDVVLQKQYPSQLLISYSNRQTFFNALKSLYFLNFESANYSMSKKRQHYTKNFSIFFINQFSQGLFDFFRSAVSSQYLISLLKQEHSLGRNTNVREEIFIKLYKLMSKVVEQMTYYLRKQNNVDLEILKQVNLTRNQLHKNFYEALSNNQLIIQNIPIYLIYSANIDNKVVKQRVYRLSWNQYRSLLCEFIKKLLSIQVESFTIIHIYTKNEIRNEDDYRKILQIILLDYRRFNFIFDVSIQNIREKIEPARQMFSTTGSIRINQPDMFRRDIPRYMSYRMPQARDNSPYNSRRVDSSNRNHSPNFGSPCRQCNRITTNRSQFCEQCIKNR